MRTAPLAANLDLVAVIVTVPARADDQLSWADHWALDAATPAAVGRRL